MATESLATFAPFSRLPFEIRQNIYLLATPPRIVHVQEETEDRQEFEERLRTTPWQIKLDPSLAHFAPNWRRHIPPRRIAQQTLELCGITGIKAPHQPWVPSNATPEIPLRWLANQPAVAWQLLRAGYLYSKAPIPALLHTCAESRADLVSRGYQLAFRTRSNGPRTWFNFKRDVLYIDGDYDLERRDILSGGMWDVGQFHPTDLKRVRNLALNKSCDVISPRTYRPETAAIYTRQLSNVLQIFEGVTELLVVEWSEGDGERWSEEVAKSGCGAGQGEPGTSRELWRCLAVEEIDALFWFTAAEKNLTGMTSAGEYAGLLTDYKQRDYSGIPYFQHMQLQLEQLLREHRDTIVGTNTDGPVIPWVIPRIRACHILKSSVANYLSHERRGAWAELAMMKKRHREAKVSPADESATAIVQQDSPEISCCEQCAYQVYLDRVGKIRTQWWIKEGSVPVPKDEILY